MSKQAIIYVDVDETFVRNYGTKRIPMPHVIEHIKKQYKSDAVLYCWSSGGAEYAKASAKEFGIEKCFVGFLPKPDIMIDDLEISQWRTLLQIHPNKCPSYNIELYKKAQQNKE